MKLKILKGISEKKHGNMKIVGESNATIKNRRKFLLEQKLNPNNLVMASLDHGNKIIVVSEKDKGKIHQGYDGLVTDVPEIILGVTAADCLPIYFWNEKKNVIGIAHAGWKGVESEIVKEMIRIFIEKFSCNVKDIFIEIGPHIKDCHFEIKKDLLNIFSEYKECLKNIKSRYYLNLSKVVENQLISVGVDLDKISVSPECTFCNKKYFSYRRDKPADIKAVLAYIKLSLD